MTDDLQTLKREEAEFFNQSAAVRMKDGRVAIEADMRRATRRLPEGPGEGLIDPEMTRIVDDGHTARFLDLAAHQPGGRVLDVCCGMGWLSLELARRGQFVDAYDISPGAIAVGRQMLAENPYKDGFGGVTYNLQDVTEVDLGVERYDAVIGNSAFHHINDLPAFMDRVTAALKPGGIIVTVDDMPVGEKERALERLLRLALPTFDRTYRQKAVDVFKRLVGITKAPPEIFTPMEQGKHDSVFEIADIWHKRYEVLEESFRGAFSLGPSMTVKGPHVFRYGVARVIVALDRFCCSRRLTKGYLRVMVGRKPLTPR
ncbi:MAG: class I SAM-dependent methyltransferase [Gemmatimonadaceae bacterium]|nr:class I SAM-dependent methyltransferase [Gemmatimonadaceae bacterium]